jgi:hypothetical protein
MILKIALVMALLSPLVVAVPLLLSDLKLFRWLDDRLQHAAAGAAIVWAVALILAVAGWLR